MKKFLSWLKSLFFNQTEMVAVDGIGSVPISFEDISTNEIKVESPPAPKKERKGTHSCRSRRDQKKKILRKISDESRRRNRPK